MDELVARSHYGETTIEILNAPAETTMSLALVFAHDRGIEYVDNYDLENVMYGPTVIFGTEPWTRYAYQITGMEPWPAGVLNLRRIDQ